MAAHSSSRAVARAVSDVGRWGLEGSWRSNSSQRCSMGFASGLWGWPAHFWNVTVRKPFSHRPCFMAGSTVMLIQTTVIIELVFTVYSMHWVEMSLYPSAFRFTCSITRGPSSFHEKHPHTVMPLLQISLLALHMLAGILLQAFATPKPSHRTAIWYSGIHDPKSHVSSCPLSSGITLYTTLGGA
jgi:hypothetical protein